MLGVQGNGKVRNYYEANRRAVAKITRWDFLNLQHNIPRALLQIPYDLLNRLNRKRLQKQNNHLVDSILAEDHYLSDKPSECLDLFCIVEK